jgi:hypothetical protein
MQRAYSAGDLITRTSQVYRFVYATGLDRSRSVPLAPSRRKKLATIKSGDEVV